MQIAKVQGLVGGPVIGTATAVHILPGGRVTGASGILGGPIDRSGIDSLAERSFFLAGLVGIPLLMARVFGMVPDSGQSPPETGSLAALLPAGLLVGLGTRLANSRTSDHGVCGISRQSPVWQGRHPFLHPLRRPDSSPVPPRPRGELMRNLFAALAGGLFGLGPMVSGMTSASKVEGWLDVFGEWAPTLDIVMAGAIFPLAVPWRIARNRRPVLGGSFPAKAETGLGTDLVVGSLLFGAGRGRAGYCPDPTIASLGFGVPSVWIFTLAMVAGMAATPRIRNRLDAPAASA